MVRSARILVTITALLFAGHAVAIPITWPGNGHQYEVISDLGITWTDARTAALALGPGWDLASITSQAEMDFIISLLPLNPFDRQHLWLGGTDVNIEGSFEWSNGDAFGFTSWGSGEPNNKGNEDYLAFDWREAWNWNDVPVDLGFGLMTGYVVENSLVVPEPSALTLFTIGLLCMALTRRRRKINEGA